MEKAMAAHQRKTHMIPRAPVARLLMKAGAQRVSHEAVQAFAEVIQTIAEDIGSKAARIARHSGRKTVQDKDIRLAAKQ